MNLKSKIFSLAMIPMILLCVVLLFVTRIPQALLGGGLAASQIQFLIVVLVALVIGGFIIYLVCGRIADTLEKAFDLIRRMERGDLTVSIDEKFLSRNDEIGKVIQNLNGILGRIKSIIYEVQSNSAALNESSASLDELARSASATLRKVDTAVSGIADGAVSQASQAQEVKGNSDNMGTMIRETIDEADALNQNVGEISQASQKAENAVKQLEETTAQVKGAMEQIYEETISTNESVQKISEVTNLITSIASQTNLLSLNASIEAARAGEHGRGFAVVAAEIQQLAAQSNQSASEIQEILKQLTENSNRAVTAMNKVKSIVEIQERDVGNTGSEFGILQKGVSESVTSIQSIAEKSDRLEDARNSTAGLVDSLAAIAEENVSSTEETANAVNEVTGLVDRVSKDAESLSELSKKLQASISVFKV